jgi:hypothetical protein
VHGAGADLTDIVRKNRRQAEKVHGAGAESADIDRQNRRQAEKVHGAGADLAENLGQTHPPLEGTVLGGPVAPLRKLAPLQSAGVGAESALPTWLTRRGGPSAPVVS